MSFSRKIALDYLLEPMTYPIMFLGPVYRIRNVFHTAEPDRLIFKKKRKKEKKELVMSITV